MAPCGGRERAPGSGAEMGAPRGRVGGGGRDEGFQLNPWASWCSGMAQREGQLARGQKVLELRCGLELRPPGGACGEAWLRALGEAPAPVPCPVPSYGSAAYLLQRPVTRDQALPAPPTNSRLPPVLLCGLLSTWGAGGITSLAESVAIAALWVLAHVHSSVWSGLLS